MEPQRKYCLNCGNEVSGNYCRHCGQPTATGRLNFKSTAKDSVSALTRIDRGFLYTVSLLITRPWIVIRDYIGGRRVAYAAPVKMLIVLCLFSLLGDSLIDNSPELTVSVNVGGGIGSFWSRAAQSAISFYFDSLILQSLVVTVAASLAVYVVYLRYNSRRYNFAEYFTAGVYLCDASIAIQILLSPLSLLDSRITTPILLVWCGVIGVLSVVRAFPIRNYAVAFLTFIVWAGLLGLLLVLIHVVPFALISAALDL